MSRFYAFGLVQNRTVEFVTFTGGFVGDGYAATYRMREL